MLNSIVSSPRCPREADSCCRPIIITRRKRARISSWISWNPWTFSLVVRSTNVLTLAHVERIFSSKIARITIFVLGTINESLPGTGTPRGKDCLVEQWCTPIKRTLGPFLLEEVGKRKKGIERMEYRNRPSIKGPTTCRGSLPSEPVCAFGKSPVIHSMLGRVVNKQAIARMGSREVGWLFSGRRCRRPPSVCRDQKFSCSRNTL